VSVKLRLVRALIYRQIPRDAMFSSSGSPRPMPR
jgi:hypothetical protein